MRVALVTTSWPEHEDDPAGHFVRSHARQLEARGDEVTVLAPPAGGAFGWPGIAARVRARPWRAFDAARWTLTTRTRLRTLDVNRVVAHWCVPCAFPIGIAGRAPLDVVSHGGDVRLLRAIPSRSRRRIVATIARRATSWTFASERLRSELAAALDSRTRAALDRVARVEAPPLGLPGDEGALREFASARRRALGAKRLAVCVARLIPGKRVDRVIAHVAADAARPMLVVVGDGPERAGLERLARRLGADVHFVGTVPRTDALAWICAADILVHASEAEGLSTVIREALALGTCVLDLGTR